MKGVKIHKLEIKVDDRGWVTEILRNDQLMENKEFGQIYVTTAHPGVIKGNHYHKRKTEWFCVIKGSGLLALRDISTGEYEEIPLSDNNISVVSFSPNIAHGIKNVGTDMLYLIAYIDEQFDANDPDTYSLKVL